MDFSFLLVACQVDHFVLVACHQTFVANGEFLVNLEDRRENEEEGGEQDL